MDAEEYQVRSRMKRLLRKNYGADHWSALKTRMLCKLCWSLFDDLPDWFVDALERYNK